MCGKKCEDAKMKRIAITQRVDFIELYGERRDSLDQRWIQLILKCGFVPLIIPNNLNAAEQIICQVHIDGLIFTGGNNLVKYGGDAPERDSVEYYLINYAIQYNVPLLGICRGMQIIQDYFKVPLKKYEGHTAVTHELLCEGESRLKNSYHNYASKNTAEQLSVNAVAMDGIVEAVCHEKYKIFAMMWHPERNNPFDEDDLNFIKNFFE